LPSLTKYPGAENKSDKSLYQCAAADASPLMQTYQLINFTLDGVLRHPLIITGDRCLSSRGLGHDVASCNLVDSCGSGLPHDSP
jgi:hypothetical protein